MEVPVDLCKKLTDLGVISSKNVQETQDKSKYVLDKEATKLCENGSLLARYYQHVTKVMEQNKMVKEAIDTSALNGLKNSYTPAAKQFNWSVVIKEFEKVGIEVDVDTKKLILQGDLDMIADTLLKIQELEQEALTFQKNGSKASSRRSIMEQPKKKKVIKDGVDILTMNPNRDISDCESSLELLLNGMCRNFKMKPKQCAALLTNNNQYLLHTVVKGLKGKFEPVIAYYQDLYTNSKQMTDILELEFEKNNNTSTLLMILNTVKTGLFSHNSETVLWSCRLLSKLAFDFQTEPDTLSQDIYNWFIDTSQEGGISSVLHVLKRHGEHMEPVISTIIQFTKGSIPYILKELIRQLYPSPLEYTAIINDFVNIIVDSKYAMEEIEEAELIDIWLEMCIRQSDNDGKHSPEERTASIAFMADLWVLFPDKVEQREDVSTQCVTMLKRGAKDSYRPLRLSTLCQLFRLLDLFSANRNPFAPSIFKILSFSLIENYDDATTREYIMINMQNVFDTQPGIPVSFVIEPLIKQFQIGEDQEATYNTCDFDFLATISNHQKLTFKHGLQLTDIMAKIYFNDIAYATCSSNVFMVLAKRYVGQRDNPAMRDFLKKFLTIAIESLVTLEPEKGKKKKKRVKVKEPMLAKSKKGRERMQTMDKEEEEEVNRSLKKTLVIEVCRKIQNLRNNEINDQMRELLLPTQRKCKDMYGYWNIGIFVLLKWWGDPKLISEEYVRVEEDKERKEREAKEAAEEAERQAIMLAKQQEEDSLVAQSMEMVPYGDEVEGGKKRRRKRVNDSADGALVPFQVRPKGEIGRKAQKELNRLKHARKEKEYEEKEQEKIKNDKFSRQKKRLKYQLEKRKLEHGVATKNQHDVEGNLIYKDGELTEMALKETKHGLPDFALINLEDEEDRDAHAIRGFMKKYSKLWKFLFSKYANSCFSSKQTSNFDSLKEKINSINKAELTKLLKDHGFDKKQISKEEQSTLIVLVNQKIRNEFNTATLDYPSFVEWIQQASFFIFSRLPRDLSHLPPLESLKAFFNQMKDAMKKKGASTVLFEDPNSTSIKDPDLLKALNEKLQEDPNYPIPEGFRKVKEKDVVYDYKIPEYFPLKESHIDCLDILDELILEKFGFHILEPVASYKETQKIRPVIFKKEKDPNEIPQYLKDLDKRPNQRTVPDTPEMSDYKKRKASHALLPAPPRLSTDLKLEVAKFPIAERDDAQQVAEKLEELLQAVSKGMDVLPSQQGRYKNYGLKAQEEEMKRRQEEDQARELERKERHKRVKNRVKKKDERRKKELRETRVDRLKQTRQQRDERIQQQQDLEEKVQKREKAREEKRDEELDEINRKEKDERRKNREKDEQRKEKMENFLKSQKDKLQNQFDQEVNIRKNISKAEKEKQRKEVEVADKLAKDMHKYFEKNKENFESDKKEREAIDTFVNADDSKKLFEDFKDPLEQMFYYYSVQSKFSIGREMEEEMHTMNKKQFVQFGYEQNIVPNILPVSEMNRLYNVLVRERLENDDSKDKLMTIDYPHFLKCIVRIAALGQEALGGQDEDTYKKKKEEIEKKQQKDKDFKRKMGEKAQKDYEKWKQEEEEKNEWKYQSLFPGQTLKQPVDKKSKKKKGDDTSMERDSDSDGTKSRRSKSREQKGGKDSLMTRGAKPPRQKLEKKNIKIDTLKAGTLIKGFKGKGDEDQSDVFGKANPHVNKLYDLEQEQARLDHLSKVRVDDIRVAQEVDVSIITANTVEQLLRFMDLDPEDGIKERNQKLYASRIQNQGHLPNKLKLKKMPKKGEPGKSPVKGADKSNDSGDESDGKTRTEHTKSQASSRSGTSTKN